MALRATRGMYQDSLVRRTKSMNDEVNAEVLKIARVPDLGRTRLRACFGKSGPVFAKSRRRAGRINRAGLTSLVQPRAHYIPLPPRVQRTRQDGGSAANAAGPFFHLRRNNSGGKTMSILSVYATLAPWEQLNDIPLDGHVGRQRVRAVPFGAVFGIRLCTSSLARKRSRTD